jgi:hypothetical protein
MDDHAWVPVGVPLDKPSPARIYDYYLGGYHNFQLDREMADAVEKLFPDVRLAAAMNRAFLRRAVTFLVEQGCEQFLDLGSGIPTVGNVHEVAQSLKPEARVVYVDIDSVAVAHSHAILAGNPYATAILADVRDPRSVLTHPEVARLLDLEKPLGILMVALLHYLLDDGEADVTARAFRSAAAPGSYLAIAHPIVRDTTAEVEAAHSALIKRGSRTQDRTAEQILGFFGDWPLVSPGLVRTPLWRPEVHAEFSPDDAAQAWAVAGVACKGITAVQD